MNTTCILLNGDYSYLCQIDWKKALNPVTELPKGRQVIGYSLAAAMIILVAPSPVLLLAIATYRQHSIGAE